MSMDKLCKKFKKNGRTFLDYYAIQTAIPKKWKKRIKKTLIEKNDNVAYCLKWKGMSYSRENVLHHYVEK